MKMKAVLTEVEKELLNRLTRLASLLGLNEAAGRIWGVLLLTGGSLSQKEISKLTNYSLGIVSMNLSRLESLGLVKIVKRVGKKKFYAASSSLTDLFKNFVSLIADNHLEALVNHLQNTINSFDDHTKKNAEAILHESKKFKLFLKNLIEKLK
ncbi:MAG: hypothetical protein DRN04_04840 [Thermoprotei archaeon]|nr:MAG: hypothetical protein DRN04_04840 [Thermoprotei archaeon]